MIFSKIANFTSEIRRFGQVYTGYFDGETLYLILDMYRNIGQPVEFYFRGVHGTPPLTAKLILHCVQDGGLPVVFGGKSKLAY